MLLALAFISFAALVVGWACLPASTGLQPESVDAAIAVARAQIADHRFAEAVETLKPFSESSALYLSLVGLNRVSNHDGFIRFRLLLLDQSSGPKSIVCQVSPQQTQPVHCPADQELESQLPVVVRDEPPLHQQKDCDQRRREQ